ncbi:deoxynucleotidyltransferase terminal-interacting protein 1 [Rhodnius prolixus]|uniref:deoxynucleotidyltransferase terminal-interacting protein 1 n=1 Tax=Rhodnius prolixus TaxID=13249 RepID=UPI003D18A23C
MIILKMVVSHTLLIGNTELQNSKALWYARIMMDVTSIEENKEVTMVHWKNTFNLRPLTLAALSNGKNIGRTGQHPLSKMRCRSITSAAKSLDILRQNLQATINKEIDLVIRKYLEKFFQPAVKNIRENLGPGSVSEELVRDVCRAMLEEAKQMYCAGISVSLHKNANTTATNLPSDQFLNARKRKVSDTDKESTQRKRSYPPLMKWDPSRVTKDTQFILSTCASKALGLGAIRGRLSMKHPEIVKYMVDQDDREWLSTARVPGLIQGTPNISLMFLDDIVQIVNCDEYRNNPQLCLNELKGFGIPDFIQRKIRAYMTLMRTKYLTTSTTDSCEIQMSVGVGVECVSSSLAPLSLIDTGLIELESPFLSLTSTEEDE